MPDIITSRIFTDGEKGITATKMNDIIGGAAIQTYFYSSKAASPTLDATDQLLELKAGGTYARITGTQLINSVAGQLTLADTVQNGMLRKVSGLATDFVDGTNNCQTLWKAFVSKSAAYTLTNADSGKYVICSGGSWTLTLPAPAAGLLYQLRNDMGITAPTGTITLQPTGGTIDGLASRALLPQQECTLITDGTNWRTFGLKREVILGTQDITSSAATGSVLLPLGFRFFELNWTGLTPVTDGSILAGKLSSDGGSTWLAGANYHNGLIYPASATLVGYSNTISGTSINLSINMTTAGGLSGQIRMTLFPGNGRSPTWIADSVGYRNSDGVIATYRAHGIYNVGLQANALQYYFSAGNIANSFLTVKGVV